MIPFPHNAHIQIADLAALSRFAAGLAGMVKAGDVVALDGPLGAGKTTLTQKIAVELGITEPVSSPTFVLMNEYRSGAVPLVHVDLYRLGPEKAASLAEELYGVIDEGRSILLVEWATYGAFLDELITIRLSIQPDQSSEGSEVRFIQLSANRPLPESLAEDLN